MNLRALAEADNATILEDDENGFAVPITLTPPNPSVAVAAVLVLAVVGVDGTVMTNNLRWKIGDAYYRQSGQAAIANGTASVSVVAEVAGDAGNQADGTVLDTLPLVAGITGATVSSTTTEGEDKAPDTVYQVKGQYHRVGVEIDPETGLTVPGNKSSVTFRLSRLNGVPPEDGWLVETTDITGAAVKGKAKFVMLDRTAGRATLMMGK